jgi:hypothetical protein
MTMNRGSILLAVLLALPATAARAEDGAAAEQVTKLELLASLAGARGDSQEAEALRRRALAVAATGPGVPGLSVAPPAAER